MSKDMAAADMLFLQCFSLDFAPWAALKKKLTQTAWREEVLQMCLFKYSCLELILIQTDSLAQI